MTTGSFHMLRLRRGNCSGNLSEPLQLAFAANEDITAEDVLALAPRLNLWLVLQEVEACQYRKGKRLQSLGAA